MGLCRRYEGVALCSHAQDVAGHGAAPGEGQGSRKDERHVPGRVWLAVPQLAEGTTLIRACPESYHDQTRTALTIVCQTSGSV